MTGGSAVTGGSAATDWLAEQLPAYLVEDRLFRTFLAVFTELAGETRVHGDALAHLADLDVTAGPMLRYLGQWLAFGEIDPGLPDHRQRELLGRLGSIVAWRGTRRGLTELFTLLTQDEVEVTAAGPTSPDGPRRKIVTVRVANTAWLTPEQFIKFVGNEIPADCTLTLVVNGHELTKAATGSRRRDQ